MEKPNKWMLVRITGSDPHWRIFATWSGSYLHGDSWKLNSGIEAVEDKDDYFEFKSYSGNIYRCHKNGYGITVYGAGVLESLLKTSGDRMKAIWEEPTDILECIGMK